MHQEVLPIKKTPEHEYFLTPKGDPIWPVRTRAELSGLVRLATVFGSRVDERDGRQGRSEPEDEEVLGLGEGTAEVAALYAHLTKRNYRLADNLKDVLRGNHPAVVITTPEWVTVGLLDMLYSNRAAATGIIYADTPAALRFQVLLRAAATVLSGPSSIKRIDISPTVNFSHFVSNGREVLGGEATPKQIEKALSRGASVLSVMTHCDGIDAYLGSDLTLCPFTGTLPKADARLDPRCIRTGFCHRHQITIRQSLKSGHLLSPGVFSARVLLFNVCLGLLPVNKVVDPAWGLMPQLISNPSLGAIVTTWQMVLTDPLHTDSFGQSLVEGKSLGEALVEFNNLSNASALGHRMCLIGDPKVRSTRAATESKSAHSLVASAAGRRELTTKPLKELAFMRACLLNVHSDRKDIRLLAGKALKAIHSYEQSVWSGTRVEGTEQAPGSIMRKSLISLMFKNGTLNSKQWLRLASDVQKVKQPTKCFFCSSPTTTMVAKLRIPGVSRRRITICPLCGMIEDAPATSNLSLKISNDSVIEIAGRIPRNRWQAGLLLQSDLPSESIAIEWPRDVSGAPLRNYAMPSELPIGPVDLSFFMISDTSLTIISRRIRGR